FRERFDRGRICVVRLEDLAGEDAPGWRRVLEHLGVPFRQSPGAAENVTADKPQYTAAMVRLWKSGALERLRWVPGPARSLGKRVLSRRGDRYRRRLEDSRRAIPDDITRPLWDDAEQLRAWLGA